MSVSNVMKSFVPLIIGISWSTAAICHENHTTPALASWAKELGRFANHFFISKNASQNVQNINEQSSVAMPNLAQRSIQTAIPTLKQERKIAIVHALEAFKCKDIILNNKSLESKFLETQEPYVSVFVDTTFIRKKSQTTDQEKSFILDGAVVLNYQLDQKSNKHIYGIGFGDGYRGHVDELEDKHIAAMSAYVPYYILNTAFEKLNNLYSLHGILKEEDIAATLKDAFLTCANTSKKYQEYVKSGAGTTVSCSFVFFDEQEKKAKLVGFNYGDQRIGMIHFDSADSPVYTSIANGATLDGSVPHFPNVGKNPFHEYIPIHQTLGLNTFLSFNTDGIVLPTHESSFTKINDDDLTLETYHLEDDTISEGLEKLANNKKKSKDFDAHDTNKMMVQYSYNFINENRSEKLNEFGCDGDDVLSFVFGPIKKDLFIAP